MLISRNLECVLRSIVNPVIGYDFESPSRRLEGVLGTETTEDLFSPINVYLQGSDAFHDNQLLVDIIRQCYQVCRRINSLSTFPFNLFLFNDSTNNIQLINKLITFKITHASKDVPDLLSGFSAGNIRVLEKLTESRKPLRPNALCIFITDENGFELGKGLSSQRIALKKHAVHIKIHQGTVHITKGLPIY